MQGIPCRTDAEIEALARCAKAVWNEHYSSILSQAQIDYMVEKFQSAAAIKKAIIEEGYQYYRIEDDQHEVVAYCGFQVQEKQLFLSKLYVQKAWRNHGLASKLLAQMIEYARHHQLKAIVLTCNRYNTNSLAFYQKKGFQIVDRADSDIGHGFVMEDYILTKAIV